jgi:two-component system alkaline phosphatase synthesis response regulator PhoP
VQKVLVVEDHPEMRALLVHQVKMMGFFPVAAADGNDGVEKAIQEAPILALMDMMMPGWDGLEAARILRSDGATKHIAILAATVLFSEYDLESCLRAGYGHCLVKHFTYQQFRAKDAKSASAVALLAKKSRATASAGRRPTPGFPFALFRYIPNK